MARCVDEQRVRTGVLPKLGVICASVPERIAVNGTRPSGDNDPIARRILHDLEGIETQFRLKQHLYVIEHLDPIWRVPPEDVGSRVGRSDGTSSLRHLQKCAGEFKPYVHNRAPRLCRKSMECARGIWAGRSDYQHQAGVLGSRGGDCGIHAIGKRPRLR